MHGLGRFISLVKTVNMFKSRIGRSILPAPFTYCAVSINSKHKTDDQSQSPKSAGSLKLFTFFSTSGLKIGALFSCLEMNCKTDGRYKRIRTDCEIIHQSKKCTFRVTLCKMWWHHISYTWHFNTTITYKHIYLCHEAEMPNTRNWDIYFMNFRHKN